MSGDESSDPVSASMAVMPPLLTSPVCALVARTNVDAQLKAILLNEAGIPAVAVEDISMAGYFPLGAIDNIHRPQVFVDQSELAAARSVLAGLDDHSVKENPDRFCFHCGADLEASGTLSRCPECQGLLKEDEETALRSEGDRFILHGRSLFQAIQKIGVAVFLGLLIPKLLWGLYAALQLIIAPLRW